jgi:NTE family protein
MRGEEMTWRHLLAACAVPLGFPPVRINGRLFVDGGLLCVLPTGVAAELGATHIVAVNVMPAMPSRVVRGAVRAVQYMAPDGCPAAGADVQIRTIVPDPPLGRLADSVRWEPESVRLWMERGVADAARLASSPAGVFV